MLSKVTECLSMSSVAHKGGSFSLLCFLFGVVSGSIQPVLACSRSLHFLQVTASKNVLISKFTINQLHVDFITKQVECHYKVGQLFCIAKQGKWYYNVGQILQSGATSTTKWGKHYKEGP